MRYSRTIFAFFLLLLAFFGAGTVIFSTDPAERFLFGQNRALMVGVIIGIAFCQFFSIFKSKEPWGRIIGIIGGIAATGILVFAVISHKEDIPEFSREIKEWQESER